MMSNVRDSDERAKLWSKASQPTHRAFLSNSPSCFCSLQPLLSLSREPQAEFADSFPLDRVPWKFQVDRLKAPFLISAWPWTRGTWPNLATFARNFRAGIPISFHVAGCCRLSQCCLGLKSVHNPATMKVWGQIQHRVHCPLLNNLIDPVLCILRICIPKGPHFEAGEAFPLPSANLLVGIAVKLWISCSPSTGTTCTEYILRTPINNETTKIVFSWWIVCH